MSFNFFSILSTQFKWISYDAHISRVRFLQKESKLSLVEWLAKIECKKANEQQLLIRNNQSIYLLSLMKASSFVKKFGIHLLILRRTVDGSLSSIKSRLGKLSIEEFDEDGLIAWLMMKFSIEEFDEDWLMMNQL